jgi:amino acid adenylation domain-containing protein
VQALDAPRATAADLAYVLYTSGSTGVPKGVAVTHANAVHYARAVSRVLAGIRPDAAGDGFATLDGLRFGMVSTMAADLGYTSVLGALLAGGTLHILPKDATTEPARFAEQIAAQPLDVLKITPGHLHALVGGRTGRDLAELLPRRWLVLGGEALRPDLARTILSAGACRLLNHYGPTETTVGACTFEVTAASLDAAVAQGAQTIPIGQPLANTRAFVVDVYGAEQPVGVPGELLLAGAGVATGYLGRAELTAERFGRRGELRTYRTGDRVRRLPSGAIEFLGRVDDQVKVRGFRVELGEIEQALRALPAVAQAVVALRDGGGGEPVLAAYVVPKMEGYAASHGERATPESLRAALSAQLPDYMVPAAVLLLDSLPLTANGKVDRAALPVPGVGTFADRYVAPRNAVEEQLVAIWSEALKRDRIGIRDNFLELGGHSLLAIRVLGKISKGFGVRLPLRTLFDAPTIEQLGAIVESARATSAPAAAGIGAASRDAYRIGKSAPAGGPAGGNGGSTA